MEYLAFDFGDGTVCAARFRSAWAETQNIQEPEVLHIKVGKQELWSTLAQSDRQGCVVGISKPRRGFELEVNWKAKPSQRDAGWLRRRSLTVMFMENVFKVFLNNNPDYGFQTGGNGDAQLTYNGNPCKIAIGVPCDWSDADIAEYKKIAREAGLGDVQVFKEAQAAVLYARRFMGDGLPDEYIENGTLLIDIGSSTTDFTYLKCEKASNRGLTLGAKYIENSFLEDARIRAGYEYYKAGDTPESIKAAENTRNWNLLEVRGYKEDFFVAADEAKISKVEPEIETEPLAGTNLELGNAEAFITRDYVDRCLNDGSAGVRFRLPHLSEKWAGSGLDAEDTWRGHFRKALAHLRQAWEIDSAKVTIIVTGGASRMQFVENDVKAVFGSMIRYRAGDPGQQSFSVVKGLAWASYATDLISRMRTGLKARIDELLQKETVKSTVCKIVYEIGDIITDEIVNGLSSLMQNSPTLVNTKRKIADYATNKAKEILVKVRTDGVLSEKIKSVVTSLLSDDELKNLFADLQGKLGRSTIYAKLPPLSVLSVDVPDVNVNLDLDQLINGIMVAIIYVVLLCIPGFGWFLALVMAVVGSALINKLLEKGPDDIIDAQKIQKGATAIPNKKQDIREKIYGALGNADEGGFMWAVSNAVARTLVDVKMQELDALEGLANYRD